MIDISERLLISWKRTHISERNFITQTWKTSRYCTALFPNSTLQSGLIGLSKHPIANLVFSVWWKQIGKLAKELDFVSHHVRTKLDELKRQEVNRLRTLIKVKQDINGEKGITGSSLLVLLFCGSHLPWCILWNVLHHLCFIYGRQAHRAHICKDTECCILVSFIKLPTSQFTL